MESEECVKTEECGNWWLRKLKNRWKWRMSRNWRMSWKWRWVEAEEWVETGEWVEIEDGVEIKEWAEINNVLNWSLTGN